MFQILLSSYQRLKGQKFFSFLLHAEKEGHEGSLGKCVKQILIENEIQVGQKSGFATSDIVANYSSYCIHKTNYHTKKVKSLRDSSVCEFIQGPNLCLGSIRKVYVLNEGHIGHH